MLALELLKQYQYADEISGGYLATSLSEAIQELESLELYVKSLEEYKRLVRTYLQIEKCSCGTLKVKGYLCSNKDCEKE